MSRSRFSLVMGLLAVMTIWGCAQNGGMSPSAAAKAARLQEEVQSLTSQRDQLRHDLRAVQAEKDRLAAEVEKLRLVVKERDQLKHDLETVTAERDASLAHLESIRRGVKALMEQVEAALPGCGPVLGTSAKTAGNAS